MLITGNPLPLVLFSILAVAILGCPPNCIDCDEQATTCYACADGYELDVTGGCVEESTVPHCSLYGQNGLCFACRPTYSLVDGLCKKHYSGCLVEDPSWGQCFSCGFGTFLQQGACIGAINCHLSEAVCTGCLPGFTLVDGQCHDETGNCEKLDAGGLCEQCKAGFQLVGFICLPKTQQVRGCYLYEPSGKCLTCKSGFTLQNEKCLLQAEIDAGSVGTAGTSGQVGGEGANTTTVGEHTAEVVHIGGELTGNTTKEEAKEPKSEELKEKTNKSIEILQKSDGKSDNSSADSLQKAKEENISISKSVGEGTVHPIDQPATSSDNSSTPNVSIAQINPTSPSPSSNSTHETASIEKQVLKTNESIDSSHKGQNSTEKIAININDTSNSTATNTTTVQQVAAIDTHAPAANTTAGLSVGPKNDTKTDNSTTISFTNNASATVAVNVSTVPTLIVDAAAPVANITPTIPSLTVGNAVNASAGNTSAKIDAVIANTTVLQAVSVAPSTNISQNLAKDTSTQAATTVNVQITPNSTSTDGNSTVAAVIPPTVNTTIVPSASVTVITKANDSLPIITQPPISAVSANKTDVSNPLPSVNASTPPINLTNAVIAANTSSSYGSSTLPSPDPLNSTTTISNPLPTTGTIPLPIPPSLLPLLIKDNQSKASNATDANTTKPNTIEQPKTPPTPPVDPNCRTPSPTGCLQCSSGFFKSSNGLCSMVNPLCRTYDPQTGTCTSCFVGYSLSGALCTIANVPSKPKCSQIVKDICTKCYSGYYLSKGGCLQANPLCKTYNSTGGDCFSCYSGYYLERGGCLVATLESLPGCVKLDSFGGCAACYSGYVVEKVDPSKKRRTCKSLNPLCKTYDDVTNGCASCYPGYVQLGIDCVLQSSNDPYCASSLNEKCLSCTSGRYLASNGTCLLADPLCREVQAGTGRCLSCYPGYYLDGGRCLLPVASALPFCDLSVNNRCISCFPGYSLSTGACKSPSS